MMTDSEIIAVVDEAVKNYRGQVQVIEQAVGALIVGRRFGWRVLYLVHEGRTIRRYQDVLGVKFREALPEVGNLAYKSLAWKIVDAAGKFWDVVKRKVVLPELKDKVQQLS